VGARQEAALVEGRSRLPLFSALTHGRASSKNPVARL
jgi:hypothetical protein